MQLRVKIHASVNLLACASVAVSEDTSVLHWVGSRRAEQRDQGPGVCCVHRYKRSGKKQRQLSKHRGLGLNQAQKQMDFFSKFCFNSE